MAKAPKPGTTQPKPDLPALSVKVDGEVLVVDLKTMTLAERRKAREVLKQLDEPDDVEAIAASIWVVLRRSDPGVDFMALLDKLTFGDIAESEPVEPRLDDPEA